MPDCEDCNGAIPRENVFTQVLNGDERITYVHCDFCRAIRVSLEYRDGFEWCLATTSKPTLAANPRMYRQEIRAMHQAMSADVEAVVSTF